jgi:hypothetical protein
MARTKVTARKTTGGKAPRYKLSQTKPERRSISPEQLELGRQQRELEDRRRRDLFIFDHQFQQKETFENATNAISGYQYPFIEIGAEVPKLWRGDRLFFKPSRIQITWLTNERVEHSIVFEPFTGFENYFVATDPLRMLRYSDNRSWIRDFYYRGRPWGQSAETKAYIEEFSETEQNLRFRIVVPVEFSLCSWINNPVSMKLRYFGFSQDIIYSYSSRNTDVSNVCFKLTEEEKELYAERARIGDI